MEEHFGFELRREDDHEEHDEKDRQQTTAEPSAGKTTSLLICLESAFGYF